VTEELLVADQEAWRAWLAEHHEQPDAVLLVLAKKGMLEPTSLTYDQALDEALCQGWIDGQLRRRDEATYLQRFSPRRPRSPWSARNVGHVARLDAEGRMRPHGLAEVEAARTDGRWEAAYAGSATAELPGDLATAIAKSPAAQAMWEACSKANQYAIIWRTGQARRADARARRIAAFVEMLERGETPHPQKRSR
jgi:uncharacterized protein YdeI (YjbR/CyaY-like superfamily)